MSSDDKPVEQQSENIQVIQTPTGETKRVIMPAGALATQDNRIAYYKRVPEGWVCYSPWHKLAVFATTHDEARSEMLGAIERQIANQALPPETKPPVDLT